MFLFYTPLNVFLSFYLIYLFNAITENFDNYAKKIKQLVGTDNTK